MRITPLRLCCNVADLWIYPLIPMNLLHALKPTERKSPWIRKWILLNNKPFNAVMFKISTRTGEPQQGQGSNSMTAFTRFLTAQSWKDSQQNFDRNGLDMMHHRESMTDRPRQEGPTSHDGRRPAVGRTHGWTAAI
jgi:hypothetical protein